MSSTNNAAIYVGRIGGLAVALGVGAAIASGSGVAWADTADSSSSTSSESKDRSESKDTTKSRDTTKSKDKPGQGVSKRDRDAPTSDSSDTPTKNTPKRDSEDDADSPTESSADTEGAKGDRATEAAAKKNSTPPRTVRTSAAESRADAPATTAGTVDEVADPSVGGELLAPLAVVTTAADPAPTTTPAVRSLATQAKIAPTRPRLTTRVLNVLGVNSTATNSPTAPAQSPALAALLGWVRREAEVRYAPGTQQASPAAALAAAAVVDPLPSSLDSNPVGWVTGDYNINCRPFRCVTGNQTNDTVNAPGPGRSPMGIYGTDLGIMWDGGVWNGKRFVHVAFGDTFAGPNMTVDWRSNGLVISTDNTLGNGLSLEQTGYVGQFIPGRHALGLFGSEVTVIPTAGVRILDRQYVNYMSVRSWDTPGRWTTNFSAISRYNQSNDKWELVQSTIRSAGWLRSSTPYRPGDQNFQQMAYVLQPEDQVAEGDPRYLYAFGTPSGRAGSAYLSRVAEGDVTDLGKYEYWDGGRWVAGNAAVAKPIIGSNHSSGLFGFVVDWANDPNVFGGYLGGLFGAKTGGNVSEMSVQYNEYLDKYVVLYGDGSNNIQMRVADTPEGAWSNPVQLASSVEYPGLYAPMIHPWSGTGELKTGSGAADYSNLYWNMSLWDPYNVVLMQTDLSPLQTTQV